jgi:hypothetical protein
MSEAGIGGNKALLLLVFGLRPAIKSALLRQLGAVVG